MATGARVCMSIGLFWWFQMTEHANLETLMHTVSQQHAPKLPPRSQHEPRRSKLFAFLPGHPVVMDTPTCSFSCCGRGMDDRGGHGSQICTKAGQIQPHRHRCLPFCTATSMSRDVWWCGTCEPPRCFTFSCTLTLYLPRFGNGWLLC